MYSVFEEHSTEGLTEDATDSAESVERRRKRKRRSEPSSATTPSPSRRALMRWERYASRSSRASGTRRRRRCHG